MQPQEEGLKEGLHKRLQKELFEKEKEVIVKPITKAVFTVAQITEYLDLKKGFVEKILKEAKPVKE